MFIDSDRDVIIKFHHSLHNDDPTLTQRVTAARWAAVEQEIFSGLNFSHQLLWACNCFQCCYRLLHGLQNGRLKGSIPAIHMKFLVLPLLCPQADHLLVSDCALPQVVRLLSLVQFLL